MSFPANFTIFSSHNYYKLINTGCVNYLRRSISCKILAQIYTLFYLLSVMQYLLQTSFEILLAPVINFVSHVIWYSSEYFVITWKFNFVFLNSWTLNHGFLVAVCRFFVYMAALWCNVLKWQHEFDFDWSFLIDLDLKNFQHL